MDNEGHLDCKVFMEKVMASLDGALDPAEEKLLMMEVRYHVCCLEQINIARCYKTFLAQKVSRKTVDPSLIEDIKAQIARESAR
jgi:hypothetical protein